MASCASRSIFSSSFAASVPGSATDLAIGAPDEATERPGVTLAIAWFTKRPALPPVPRTAGAPASDDSRATVVPPRSSAENRYDESWVVAGGCAFASNDGRGGNAGSE